MSAFVGGDNRAVARLGSLYSQYGYMPYQMSKFEEYDLYVRNKDFLISDSVITFTDTTGKLMALKPDVTLSIIKNSTDVQSGVQKVYYRENVYRVSKGTKTFKEIMQVGLECFGEIDDYAICEVLTLAAKSLAEISPMAVLDVSHLGLLSGLLEKLSVSAEVRSAIIALVGEKNTHELRALCAAQGIAPELSEALLALLAAHGAPREVLCALSQIALFDKAALAQLSRVVEVLEACGLCNMVRLDCSVTGNLSYYNGIVFRGFVQGVPAEVLSGGQYDKLMQKMHRRGGAIGFAVYADLLDRLFATENEFDVDTVLLYSENESPARVACAVAELTKAGERVLALRDLPQKLRFRRALKLQNGEVFDLA